MSSRLPPLNALRAFETTARTGSLTRAAQELCVTQGAISRHVSQLEQWLGVSLLTRTRRGTELTPEGASYFRGITPAFQELELQTKRLLKKPDANILKLKLPPTFAMRWLIPRLSRFHNCNRHMDVQIITSHHPADFRQEDIDIAIYSGYSPASDMTCHRLFGEILLPVCSPALLEKHPTLTQPADLADYVLLCSMHRPHDWPDWFKAANLPMTDNNSSLKFGDSALTYQAAINGLGIAIAQYAFVKDDLRNGRLVELFNLRIPAKQTYFITYPHAQKTPKKVRIFENWIISLIKEEEEQEENAQTPCKQ